MKKSQKIICAVLSLLSIIVVLSFKSIPTGQLWNDYSVLYVPVQTDDATVINAIESAGITKAIYLSGQYLPVMLSQNSPEVAMYWLNSENPDFSYVESRNQYFFDKANNFRVYYIPLKQKNKLSSVVNTLASQNIQAGVDSTAAYPWFLPLLCIALAVVFIYFSKKRLLFAASIICPVLFVFCNPFYPIAIANFLIQLVIFFIINLWKRKGALKRLVSTYVITAMSVVAILTPFGCSIKCGILFIICLIGTSSTMICYYQLEKYVEAKQSFTAVPILSARMISIYSNKQKKILPTLTAFGFVVVILFVLTSSDSINAHFSKIQLPAGKGIPSQQLPALDDYCTWVWNVKTSPYRSLNQTGEADYVEYPRYVEKDGVITQQIQSITNDKEFKDNAIAEIDDLPYDSIESLIKKQNKDFTPSYASTSSYHIGFFGIIMMVLCLFVLLFLYISSIIKKGVGK